MAGAAPEPRVAEDEEEVAEPVAEMGHGAGRALGVAAAARHRDWERAGAGPRGPRAMRMGHPGPVGGDAGRDVG